MNPSEIDYAPWKVVRQLGQGSFGSVYEICREEFGETYTAALKVISIPQDESEVIANRANGMDDQSMTSYYNSVVQELTHEFAILSKLKGHTNIVGYEDHKVVPHANGIGCDIYIRMELLKSLTQIVSQRALERQEVLKLGIDICEALCLCENKSIIHRDIKPDNIFISENGDFELGDFGIARTASRTIANMSRKGTPNYMAPEVYKNQPYNSSVDIYSLGIVLYQLMNNRRLPFIPKQMLAEDRETALGRRMSGEPLPPPEQADQEFARIILKACAYNPNDRYISAEEMKRELKQLYDQETGQNNANMDGTMKMPNQYDAQGAGAQAGGYAAGGANDAASGYNMPGGMNGSVNGYNTAGGVNGSMNGYNMAGGTNASMNGYNMAGGTNGSMNGYNMAGGTNGSMNGYNMAGGTNGSMNGYNMAGGNDGSMNGYNMPGGNTVSMNGNGTMGGYNMGGNAAAGGNATMNGNAQMNGNVQMNGNATMGGYNPNAGYGMNGNAGGFNQVPNGAGSFNGNGGMNGNNNQGKKGKNPLLFVVIGVVAAILILIIVIAVLASSGKDEPAVEEVPTETVESQAPETEEETASVQEETTEAQETQTVETQAASGDILATAELSDFVFELEGYTYQLPVNYSDFVSTGWTLDDYNITEDSVIGANSYEYVNMTNGISDIYVYLYNASGNAKTANECRIGGLEIYARTNLDFTIAKGITCVSTPEEVQEAFGAPSNSYTGDGYQDMQYDIGDAGDHVSFHFDTEDPGYSYIEIRYFPMTADDVTEVSQEVPEYLSTYVQPTELGDDTKVPVFALDGDIYQLPCPVSAFLDNGWSITAKAQDSVGALNEVDNALTIQKGDITVDLTVGNFEMEGALTENCAVTQIYFYYYEMENVAGDYLQFPAGLNLDSTVEDVEAACPDFNRYENNGYYSFDYSDWETTQATISYDFSTTDGVTSIYNIRVACDQWGY